MPRLVNRPTSDYSSEEEDENDQSWWAVSNRRPTYFTTTPRDRYLNSNYSQNSMPMVSFKEDEVYCLTRVTGGKVRKFKKDSRTWLHKSSEKARLKRKNPNYQPPSKLLLTSESKPSFEKINENENCLDDLTIVSSEQKNVHFQNDANIISEELDECEGGNSNNKEKSVHNEIEMDEDFMYIGDSDADLTYSEEESPVKAPPSYVETWQQKGQVDLLGSKSADNIYTQSNEAIDGNDSCQSLVSMRSLREEDSSFEHLDICNESANSIKAVPNVVDLSRRLAPAIEIEKESYRENILDYAVNKQASNLQNDIKMYSEEIDRKTRLRPRVTEASACSSGRPKRTVRPRSASSAVSRYNLRSTDSGQKMCLWGNTNQLRIAKRNPARNPEPKRARFNKQDDQTLETPGEDLAGSLSKSTSETEAVVKKPETDETAVPTCSRDDYVIRKTPPSLFVIAGYVLYAMFKCNLDNQ